MKPKDPIRQLFHGTDFVLKKYVEDLSDADLLIRPVPQANHIAWQLGHLIVAEKQLGGMVPGFVYAELPAGYKELYSKEGAGKDQGFEKKAIYVDLFNKMRDTTLAALRGAPHPEHHQLPSSVQLVHRLGHSKRSQPATSVSNRPSPRLIQCHHHTMRSARRRRSGLASLV